MLWLDRDIWYDIWSPLLSIVYLLLGFLFLNLEDNYNGSPNILYLSSSHPRNPKAFLSPPQNKSMIHNQESSQAKSEVPIPP